MTAYPLDRTVNVFTGRVHAFSICGIQNGWRLTFPAFDAITIYFVLSGSGCVRIGDGVWHPCIPGSIIVVPPHNSHALGEAGPEGREVPGGEHCAPFGDGLVAFTAGEGRRDMLMACGSIAAHEGHALGLLDLLVGTPVEDVKDTEHVRHAFDLMLAEVSRPALGTRTLIEALMQQCIVLLLRQRVVRGDWPPLTAAGHNPRLTSAVLAVLENPAGPHSVESLAASAGMGRSAFAEAFSRAFGQGPIDFVQKVRLRAAARLLATTDLPVKVVAISVGYASRSQFSRAFTEAHGTDPSGYREAARQERGARPSE